MFNNNILLATDSYKISHPHQMNGKNNNVQYMYHYIESRGGKWNDVLFFGLQMYLKNTLSKPITKDNINEAEAFYAVHGDRKSTRLNSSHRSLSRMPSSA